MIELDYLAQSLAWLVVGALAGLPLGVLARPMVLRSRGRRR